MIWAIAIVLGLLWVLGIGSSVYVGGYLHLLILAAIVLGVVGVIQGRRRRHAR